MEKKLLLMVVSVIVSFCCTNDDNENMNPGEVIRRDRDFAIKASMANYSEIEAGKKAQSKASDDAIRQFAEMMVTDHTNAKSQLKALADSAHVALLQQLDTISGHTFDSLYIHSQLKDHQNAVSLFQDEVTNGDNGRLRAFAAGMLPKLQQHLSFADSLAQKY